jgi:hypothetical protein
MKDNEIAGTGNHNTAEYWEYDTRLGRRWNVDPVYNSSESRYATNGNNPIFYNDPLGNYKTQFGAWVGKTLHGGTTIGRNSDAGSSHSGEWFYNRNRAGKGSEKSGEMDEAIVTPNHYGNEANGRKVGSGGLTDGLPSMDKMADEGANVVVQTYNAAQAKAGDVWNSGLAKSIVPDYFTIGITRDAYFGAGVSKENTWTFILRGQDAGMYKSSTESIMAASGFGADGGISISSGLYLGPVSNLTYSVFSGTSYTGSAGISLKALLGGTLSGGIDYTPASNGAPVLLGRRTTFTLGDGLNTPILGAGSKNTTSPLIRIVKFGQ